MSSRNLAVFGTPEIFIIFEIISLKDFLVNTSFTKPTSAGTSSLKITLPVVVSTIWLTGFPSTTSSIFTLIDACKSSLPSL